MLISPFTKKKTVIVLYFANIGEFKKKKTGITLVQQKAV